MRVRLDIAYEGTDFSGWARQPTLRTVQGVLESVLATLFRRHEPAPLLTVAGRTDAGVHASGQVAHVDLTADQLGSLRRRHDVDASPDALASKLAARMNGVLGADSDVVVLGSTMAPAGFDARFSAVWRRYEFRVADADTPRDPLERRRTVRHPTRLDVDAMDSAARALLGLHDYATFCKPREGATTIRTLQEYGWLRDDRGVLIARLQADAFCHSMVRALVGAAVAVGDGSLTGERLVELRDDRMRTSAFLVMPAKGLTLTEVGYPAADELARRAEQTRARRELD
ncbi:tRNA pseudouridine(38-40) synthase TruA [Cnuibacter physcomitrellae]|uniref:tRNA pseudouridine synthase A n=1 Tax=Cnuibacter physcomitrellae TaxID=1619308 RepID=A0A1X9LV87_9MICO|nr:tRNA pseudouridine synthase A [Cnuibacter physcomitrellae]ARJ07209.1 tRNA pseudouridine(38-40) synthase TruA [Cnuibacter physcomitrellae]